MISGRGNELSSIVGNITPKNIASDRIPNMNKQIPIAISFGFKKNLFIHQYLSKRILFLKQNCRKVKEKASYIIKCLDVNKFADSVIYPL